MTAFRITGSVAVLLTIVGLGNAIAQDIYREKKSSGTTVYSDRQPRPDAKPVSLPDKVTVIHTGQQASTLPYSLQEVSRRYPVVLYTSDSCDPCDLARNYLVSRGVPFTERTVNTAEEVEAYKDLGFSSSPSATIGQQVLRGFSADGWGRYLDAAEYPATSQLPAGYRNASPQPIDTAQAQDAQASITDQGTTPAAPSANESENNPAGIRF